MSKKHFIAIAAEIKVEYAQCVNDYERATVRTLATRLARVFLADNPRFDCHRFLSACGL